MKYLVLLIAVLSLLALAACVPAPLESLKRHSTSTPTLTYGLKTPTKTPTPTYTPTNTFTPTFTPTPTNTPVLSGVTWYVSKTGDNSNGQTWATAWNELNQIVWANVHAGDVISIDGGSTNCTSPFNATSTSPYDFPSPKPGVSCGMEYTTTLTVGASGTSTSPIIIRLSSDVGRNGAAVFFGGRSNTLPYCNQTTYTNQSSLADGINIGNYQYVTIDGIKRSGIVIYGYNQGINLTSSSTSNVIIRNSEVFDNGVATFGNTASSFGSSPFGSPTGWWSDGWAVALNGSNLTFDRDLFHDNGQDVLHGGNTVNNISILNSWFYTSRESANYAGYGFMTGPSGVCIHPDGLQLWAGGPDSGMTVQNSIIGPYLNQGIYPTNSTTPQYNNVNITNVLFLNVVSDAINTVDSATTGWSLLNVTFYRYGLNPAGSYCCSIDGNSWPSSDNIAYSIDYGGDVNAPSMTGSHNIYYNSNGAVLPGGINVNPNFVSGLTTSTPTWAQLSAVDTTAQCTQCAGVGASLHTMQDILTLIDSLN